MIWSDACEVRGRVPPVLWHNMLSDTRKRTLSMFYATRKLGMVVAEGVRSTLQSHVSARCILTRELAIVKTSETNNMYISHVLPIYRNWNCLV